jgi:CheY-like chemotaxis protein
MEMFSQNADLQMLSLIIGTDLAIRQKLRRALEAQDIVVVEVSEAEHAIDLAIGLLPDFVWVDTTMPKADINQVLDALQTDSEAKDIPVIVVENGRGRSNMDSEHIKSVLHHPISSDQVTQIIKSLTET